jgi:lambda family phage portal protein
MMWPFKSRGKPTPDKGRSIAVRGFAAAQTDRLLAGWRWDGGYSAQEIRGQLATVRSRSREMAKNNPAMRRYLSLFATNVVGEGFTLKSVPHDGIPGTASYRLDTQASKFIEYHFWRWSTWRDPSTNATWCDATGRKTLAQMDSLNAKTWARDGEYLMIPAVANNPYGISFRIIRPDALDETYNREGTATENPVYCGIEIDRAKGRPVAYYFHTLNPQSGIRGLRGPLIRVPAEKVIHGFTQEDEDQPRGVPLAHSALIKLKMLEEYDKAEITAARDEACSVRTYHASSDDPEGVVDLTSEEYAAVANALVADKEPGQSEVLPPGWDSKVNTPQHPNRELTAFKTSMNKDVASGFGIEYSNAFNDWAGVSFSSVRAGTISERDMWCALQSEMIAQSKSPVFLMWLQSFLSLSVSGSLPPSKLEKFAEHEFRGRRWMWVDPMKDINAAEKAVKNGWKTNTQIAADYGTDYGDNIEELKREQSMSDGVLSVATIINAASQSEKTNTTDTKENA